MKKRKGIKWWNSKTQGFCSTAKICLSNLSNRIKSCPFLGVEDQWWQTVSCIMVESFNNECATASTLKKKSTPIFVWISHLHFAKSHQDCIFYCLGTLPGTNLISSVRHSVHRGREKERERERKIEPTDLKAHVRFWGAAVGFASNSYTSVRMNSKTVLKLEGQRDIWETVQMHY